MFTYITRRQTLKLLGGGLAVSALAPLYSLGEPSAEQASMLQKAIPSSDEKLPVIGMGTWQTFNVGSDEKLRLERTEVLKEFFNQGGGMVDCSPMYGSSAAVLGFALNKLGKPNSLFSAEKVWTSDGDKTQEQTREQSELWGVNRFDLMQVHNLLSWRDHLDTLQKMKSEGTIRYVGITTSHGRRHADFEQIMASEDIDFVQLTYNITHREVENRLLPLAREKGIAVIANRPYDGGDLIKQLKRRHQVPEWAATECGCQTWADFLLKFIVSHPAATCAIPATTRVAHMQENMRAGQGPMPDAELRKRMIRHIESL